MYSIGNLLLAAHRTMAMTNDLNPTELLIYVTVSIANVQKLMRAREIPPGYAATDVLPREWVVPISRNAIAAATGLPRETVRRQVAQMIERDLLIEDERGGVTAPPGFIDTLNLVQLLDPLITEYARATETMLRIGAIEVHAD